MSAPPSAMSRVVCFGECMLELQGQAFGDMRQGYGGDTLNTAVYLARCGARQGLRVDYATALGDDPLSAGLLQRWQAEGLGTDLVRRLPGRLPGLYLIEVDADGERCFSYWRDQAAARAYFDCAQTPLEALLQPAPTVGQVKPMEPVGTAERVGTAHGGAALALYFSGISLAILPPAGRQRLLGLAALVRQQGGVVAFDNNYRPRLWPDVDTARSAFSAATTTATLALMTLDDEQALWDQPDAQQQLAHTLQLPCAEVVVKRGVQPTLVRYTGQPPTSVPTEPVLKVVDTTAAGDSFAGAYLAARLGGATPPQAAAQGNRLAARVVQHRGAVLPLAAMADLLS